MGIYKTKFVLSVWAVSNSSLLWFHFLKELKSLCGITEKILDNNATLCDVSEATVCSGCGTESLQWQGTLQRPRTMNVSETKTAVAI